MTFMSLFSVVPALVILWVMNRWIRPVVASIPARRAAQLMLYTSVFFIGSAVVLRMDMLMCMFIVLALHTFWRIYSGASEEENRLRRDKWLFPVWVFLAIFSKGPVGILAAGQRDCLSGGTGSVAQNRHILGMAYLGRAVGSLCRVVRSRVC